MMKDEFSQSTAIILGDAVTKIRALRLGGVFNLFHYWRVCMGKLCPVDSFYVGLFKPGSSTIVFPYNYDDGGEYDDPDYHTYGPNGLCSWLLENKRPYIYSMDNGALMHKGHSYGNTEHRSQDAVVVPLIEQTEASRKVIGKAAMQSYTPHVYGPEHQKAFVWLASIIATALRREREDVAVRRELNVAENPGYSMAGSVAEIISEVCHNVSVLRHQAGTLHAAIPADNHHLKSLSAELVRECERIQTDTMEILVRPSADADILLLTLTPREREIANMIADNMSNSKIAAALFIEPRTVTTHVSHILRKFDVKQRSEVRAKLRPFR